MGWGSATELFDGSVNVTLSFIKASMGGIDIPDALIAAVVEKTYRDINWDDWDTQDESAYFEHIVHIMHKDGHLDDGYYEWYTSGMPDNFDWSKY